MDISNRSTKKGGKVRHRHQFIDPVEFIPLEHDERPMFAEIVSQDSKDYGRSLSKIINSSRDKSTRGGDKYSHSAEKIKKANHVAACTRRLVFFENGKWVDISSESMDEDKQILAIRDAYLEYRWMLDQLDEEIVKDSNFLGKPEPSSLIS